MPRSRFSTHNKRYAIQSEPLAFSISFGPKEFNATIKRLLKDKNVETNEINFNFFINGELLTEPLKDFIENKSISQEIEEISYDVEMKPPTLEGETKTEDVITRMSFRSKWLAVASYDVQIFDVTNMTKPVIFIMMENDMFTVEWLSYDDNTQIGVIIVGGKDGEISLWRCNMIDFTAVKICKFMGPKLQISCLAVSDDMAFIASGNKNGQMSIWSADISDLDTRAPIVDTEIPQRSPLYTQDIHHRCISQIKWLSNPIEPVASARHPLALSNHGNLLTCSRDFFVKLWHVTDNACTIVREQNTTNPCNSITQNSDTGLIILGSDNNRLKVYDFVNDTAVLHNIFHAHDNSIVAAKWSATNSNMFLSAGITSDIKMWDIKNVTVPVMVVSKFKSVEITCMDCSEDGQWLAAAYNDGFLRLYRFK